MQNCWKYETTNINWTKINLNRKLNHFFCHFEEWKYAFQTKIQNLLRSNSTHCKFIFPLDLFVRKPKALCYNIYYDNS